MSKPRRALSPLAKVKRESGRVAQQVIRLFQPPAQPQPTSPSPPAIDFAPIQERYARSELAKTPETFSLWRIIGNDLTPRHRKGQSRENVAFILEHEPELQDCTKQWLLNRIYDTQEEAAIIELLERYNQPYHRIPFELSEYARQPLDTDDLPGVLQPLDLYRETLPPRKRNQMEMRIRRLKNNYAINNNGARNTALMLGRHLAKWVLPWDGNCFLSEAAWTAVIATIKEQPFLPYFIVPMARIADNALLLRSDFTPDAVEEPQIVFRTDAQEIFDERFSYGRRPKVELLWRLGVPGVWDRYSNDVFDLPRPALAREAYQFARAGWVARLSSGAPMHEVGRKSAKNRVVAREEAIIRFLDMLDEAVIRGEDERKIIG